MFILEDLKSHLSILFLLLLCCRLSFFPHRRVSGKGPGQIGRAGRGNHWDNMDLLAGTVSSPPQGSASVTQAFWLPSHHSSFCGPISTLELWSGPKLIHTHCFQAKYECLYPPHLPVLLPYPCAFPYWPRELLVLPTCSSSFTSSVTPPAPQTPQVAPSPELPRHCASCYHSICHTVEDHLSFI